MLRQGKASRGVKAVMRGRREEVMAGASAGTARREAWDTARREGDLWRPKLGEFSEKRLLFHCSSGPAAPTNNSAAVARRDLSPRFPSLYLNLPHRHDHHNRYHKAQPRKGSPLQLNCGVVPLLLSL